MFVCVFVNVPVRDLCGVKARTREGGRKERGGTPQDEWMDGWMDEGDDKKKKEAKNESTREACAILERDDFFSSLPVRTVDFSLPALPSFVHRDTAGHANSSAPFLF